MKEKKTMAFWDRQPLEDLKRRHEELENEVNTLNAFKHLTDEEERRLKDLKKTKLLIKEAIAGKEKDGKQETDG
jgi:hypothetical protein